MPLPPNRANININPLSLMTPELSSIFQSGLTADDLKPLDWSSSQNPLNRPITGRVKDQKQCGNCWAMSSTSVLEDRFRVKNENLQLNPLVTTQCTPEANNNGCNGGSVYYAGKFFEKFGAVQNDGKNNWEFFSDLSLPSCNQIPTSTKRYKIIPNSTKQSLASVDSNGNIDPDTTILNIKTALLDGPVVGQMFCTNDFCFDENTCKVWEKTGGVFINGSYNDELDRRYPSKKMGKKWADIQIEQGYPSSHAVEIVGWNNDKEIPYWIVKNSWGTNWNNGGYFKYAMYPHNNLGLDIPIDKVIRKSDGQLLFSEVESHGILFGGCLSFDPKVGESSVSNSNTSGDSDVSSTDSDTSNISNTNRNFWIFLLIFLVLSLIISIIFLKK